MLFALLLLLIVLIGVVAGWRVARLRSVKGLPPSQHTITLAWV